jgi:hypothetical protein
MLKSGKENRKNVQEDTEIVFFRFLKDSESQSKMAKIQMALPFRIGQVGQKGLSPMITF